MTGNPDDLTALLAGMRGGDAEAGNRALDAVYGQIHSLARRFLSSERSNHTLQPTALVNEAYLRLMRNSVAPESRGHFLGLAATAMRRVLVEHARQRNAAKRGGGGPAVTLDVESLSEAEKSIDVLAVDEALKLLEQAAPLAARVIELKFFGGYTDEEVAEILDTNHAKVRSEWVFGRAWLRRRLEASPA